MKAWGILMRWGVLANLVFLGGFLVSMRSYGDHRPRGESYIVTKSTRNLSLSSLEEMVGNAYLYLKNNDFQFQKNLAQVYGEMSPEDLQNAKEVTPGDYRYLIVREGESLRNNFVMGSLDLVLGISYKDNSMYNKWLVLLIDVELSYSGQGEDFKTVKMRFKNIRKFERNE